MSDLTFRRATLSDVPAIVGLLADDRFGATRESPDDLDLYRAAFARVDADPQQLQVVGERDGVLLATAQVTFIPGISRRGATRAIVEAVRVAGTERGAGLGSALMRWILDECRARGCDLVQLTSAVERQDAHRFYRRLGFVQSHAGFKYQL
ncbi:GNAT family N-acetyltransferase [Kineosporia rhizophila]|uniref:GNAT family N-acetyltransferase n=1 Tax=Kineosporia TaxID=49184 RepID=UPI001E51BBB7|nr:MULTISPECIES: GNAT family N-acetyltransferase [Kineosporia]MCE0538497.1 GNAT family N-acetyltransferase [Kineosporia rhizophila]GLY18350.1 GNAT family acetyltransferase [Kineosporia sp. NBRC 101677]